MVIGSAYDSSKLQALETTYVGIYRSLCSENWPISYSGVCSYVTVLFYAVCLLRCAQRWALAWTGQSMGLARALETTYPSVALLQKLVHLLFRRGYVAILFYTLCLLRCTVLVWRSSSLSF